MRLPLITLSSHATLSLEKDADEAHNNVDDEQACLIRPDDSWQWQHSHQRPADLQITMRTTPQSTPLHKIIPLTVTWAGTTCRIYSVCCAETALPLLALALS